jgi:hypothetical protein
MKRLLAALALVFAITFVMGAALAPPSLRACYTITKVAPPHPHYEIYVDQASGPAMWDESPVEHKIVKIPNGTGGWWRYQSPFEIKITGDAAQIPALTPRL